MSHLVVARFVAAVLATPALVPSSVAALPRHGSTPVEIILEWLDACSLLRQQRQGKLAAQKWANVLARNKMDPATLLEGLRAVGYDTLRRARVRLDIVQMLVIRSFVTSLMPLTAFLYIYCDASPQFRGHELFSASVEVVWGHGDHTSFLRRLLPQVAVRRDMMSSEMKLYTLLWQIWLMAGPGWRSLGGSSRASLA